MPGIDLIDPRTHGLAFYATAPQVCSYLPGKAAVSVFADPNVNMSTELYSRLAEFGFRRSGQHVYIPKCPGCHACIPARNIANRFQASRSQRRIISRNQDITVSQIPARYSDEYFELYRHYLTQRHSGGGMDNPTPDSFMNFLTSSWSDTVFIEFRSKKILVAVSVMDRLVNALSAVYTFFDPSFARQSPGQYAILWMIREARRLNLTRVYLGFWIEDCQKMAYKTNFHPVELLQQQGWRIKSQ